MSFIPDDNPITHPTRESYTVLRPFRFWCQKVLPLVYDDSLSYYELLCKVVDYLNKTMEDVDHMNTDMDTLYENFQEFQEGTFALYNQLVEYVNNYFDELDVQDEINEKLDVMASDGSLTSLIAPLVPDIVTAWLNEHVSPTSPAIDNTLSITGAGADARKTGNNFCSAYSASLLYHVGDFVLYNGQLYKCHTSQTVPEDWDSTKWTAINIGTEVDNIKKGVSGITKTFCFGEYNNNNVLFRSSDVSNEETIYYHIIAKSGFYGLIDLYDSNDSRIIAYGKSNLNNAPLEFSGSFQIPSNFSYAKVTAYKTGVNSSIDVVWLSNRPEPRTELDDVEKSIYYIGNESLTATSSQKMSNHGAILLEAGKTYQIMSSMGSNSNRLRFFLWKLSSGAVDTTYFVDIIPANNNTVIKPSADSYLVLYNIDNLTSITAVAYIFEYKLPQLNKTNKVYYVSKTVTYNDTHHYRGLTQCLIDLADDESDKIIYVEGGEYDIFQEYQDANVPVPPDGTSQSNYWNYNVWVPKNTHIIGRGIVKLIWSPTSSQVSSIQSKIVSPLNVADSCIIENIEVYCKNGRYCLHNDGLTNVKFIGAIQKFINCKFYKQANDDGLGLAPCTGFGISARMQHIYEDCEFYNEITGAVAFYGHSRKTVGNWDINAINSGNITMKNCIFISDYTYSIRVDNDQTNTLQIKTKLENCYLSGHFRINESSGYSNGFDVTLLKCGNATVTGNQGNYPAKIYN